MVSGNYSLQYVDWAHDPIDNEEFEHLGTLTSHIITPTITIGISDYINFSYQQTIGIRTMDWQGPEVSSHHRDESSLTDFINAIGSVFGDARFNLKYLLTNTGSMSGSRIFLGFGLVVPSNSVLTESPFLKNEDGTPEHRHFSLSDGCYKTNFEIQFYMKNITKKRYVPSFYGITFNYTKPIKESEYGYMSGDTYIAIGSMLFSTQLPKKWHPKGLSIGLSNLKTEQAYWNNEEAPNTKSNFLMPSIGLIWSDKNLGSMSINFKYIKDNSLIPEDAPNGNVESIEMSIGYRKTLNYTIPWFDF